MNVSGGEIVDQPDQLILEDRQRSGATAAIAIGFEAFPGGRARILQKLLEEAEQFLPELRTVLAMAAPNLRQRLARFGGIKKGRSDALIHSGTGHLRMLRRT